MTKTRSVVSSNKKGMTQRASQGSVLGDKSVLCVDFSGGCKDLHCWPN